MRSWLLEFYRRNAMTKNLLSIPRSVYVFLTNRLYSDEAWYRSRFLWNHGYALDLDNPRTLNEKMQWLKLYYRNPEFTNWADKHKVRDYIRDKLGEQYLIPQLAMADDPRQIDFDALPEPFIIKPTHLSGPIMVVRDKSEMDWASVVKLCRSWLKTNVYRQGREWHYKDIPPKIVVEQLLVDEDGDIPSDYKFHCIHGEIAVIQIDIDRQTNRRRNFYNVDWVRLPFTWSVGVGDAPLWPQGRDIQKPIVLRKLIELTERLARAFAYVRIDWYIVADMIYFGEVTFYHGGGYEPFLPSEWDRKLGEKLHLPKPL